MGWGGRRRGVVAAEDGGGGEGRPEAVGAAQDPQLASGDEDGGCPGVGDDVDGDHFGGLSAGYLSPGSAASAASRAARWVSRPAAQASFMALGMATPSMVVASKAVVVRVVWPRGGARGPGCEPPGRRRPGWRWPPW